MTGMWQEECARREAAKAYSNKVASDVWVEVVKAGGYCPLHSWMPNAVSDAAHMAARAAKVFAWMDFMERSQR